MTDTQTHSRTNGYAGTSGPAISDNSNLPALAESARANFPAMYEAARRAVELCDSTDEVKGWADKHAALAAYARMRDDRDLHNYALRIQLRAERRYGQLHKQLFPNRSKENLVQNRPSNPDHRQDADVPSGNPAEKRPDVRQDGTVPPVTGVQAAAQAGVTECQLKTSLRIAAVPEEDFNRQVENPNPPTKSQLAEQGRVRRVLELDPAAERFKAACSALHQFTTFCDTHDAIETAQTFGADDVEMARRCVSTLDQWLDRFVTALGTNG
jgi:hypothetical protein